LQLLQRHRNEQRGGTFMWRIACIRFAVQEVSRT
jgi:hypothetical protein